MIFEAAFALGVVCGMLALAASFFVGTAVGRALRAERRARYDGPPHSTTSSHTFPPRVFDADPRAVTRFSSGRRR